MKTNTLIIQTPEGIFFPLRLASPVTRLLAWIIDFLCMAGICMAIGGLLTPFVTISGDVIFGLVTICFFAVQIGYGMATEWFWRGQTLGKRVFKLRVVDDQGLRLRPTQIIIRNLLRSVDSLPVFYLVGGLACLISRRGQRLGDFAANTVVIQIARIEEPDLDQVLPDKYNSFRDHPHLVARLRQHVSPQEATVALQALLRRNELDAQARLDLFHDLAEHFRSISSFPQEATDGLSDEKYVRNTVDILFRARQSNGDRVAHA